MRKKAYLWEKVSDKSVRCLLCAFNCVIEDGKSGNCGVRVNNKGTLESINYNMLCASAVDPVEKKPLYHFMPGTKTYSIAAPGCNFKCKFCQNWQISQSPQQLLGYCRETQTSEIITAAKQSGCKSISYTYSEPTVFFETAADAAVEAKREGLGNIFVSNGYMSRKAIDAAADWLDAINVDLKAFSQSFYKKMTGANLSPVLETIKHISRNTQIWLEITTLLIPGLNDSEQELKQLASFLADQISPETPWHISAFYPTHNLTNIARTTAEDVLTACDIGKSAGLKYIYAGNIGADNNTDCPKCGQTKISRNSFSSKVVYQGCNCSNCGTKLPIIF